MVAKRYSHESKYKGESLIGESLANLQIIILWFANITKTSQTGTYN